jgi:hypothetical protein
MAFLCDAMFSGELDAFRMLYDPVQALTKYLTRPLIGELGQLAFDRLTNFRQLRSRLLFAGHQETIPKSAGNRGSSIMKPSFTASG